MKFNSTLLLFMWSMTIGVVISISSNSWIMMWSGIEVSMMSFIPMMSSESLLSSESCVKYFIIQSTSSMVLMLGMLSMLTKLINMYELIMLTSLSTKLGAAPFHNWVLSVIEGMNYFMMFNLLVTMKLAPLTMMSYMKINLTLIVVISMVIGSIMGMNQNSLRKIMGYSSIFNLGILLSSIKSNSVWMSYMLIYSIMMTTLLNFLLKTKSNYLNQMTSNMHKNSLKLSLWVMMLSIGGMPPTLGFSAKLMILEFLLKTDSKLSFMVMIMTSLVVMFFYLRMTTLMLMYSSSFIKIKFFAGKEPNSNLMLINIFPMPLILTLKIMM
uniref:NADH-ubiquinone oxidoreductase chain 2 n=1 Tax=Nacolus tuberculatus TaxID=2800230 RepID=A0A7T7BYV8_9HEMI|nr:NADH dehydrogenase subunit 2 [Nacolus tuberculatus]QQK57720.1 NADH dehydrogenase subunit 2 [Nacolus tuberculatus]